MKKIIVDIYGGDNAPSEIIKGSVLSLKEKDDYEIVLVGDSQFISDELKQYDYDKTRISIFDAKGIVTNTDSPAVVFRDREDSSLVQAMYLLKDACGLVTCANTGCVLVGSIFKVGLSSKSIKFPILACILPVINNRFVCICDCGANMNSEPNDLVRFAQLGITHYGVYTGIENPRVGLLSVGKEEGKGNNLTKKAYEELKKMPINFIGNIEGSDVLSGNVDVVVCDGFDGNIILKNSEAVGKISMQLINNEMNNASLETKNVLSSLYDKTFRLFDFNSQGGSTLLGVEKVIVKAHGIANYKTIISSILQLNILVNGQLAEKIKDTLNKQI